MAFDKKGREALNRLATQMKDFLDKIDGQNRPWTSDEREQYNRMTAEYTAQEEMVLAREKVGDINATLAKPATGGVTVASPEDVQTYITNFRIAPKSVQDREKLYASDIHARAFHNYLRQGKEHNQLQGLAPEEAEVLSRLTQFYNAQSGAAGSQGGYLIPQGFSDNLVEAMKWFGGVEGVVGEFETASGQPWPWPTVNDTTNKGRVIGQNVQATETDFVFSSVTFNAYILSSDIVLVPLALLEDSYFDVDAMAARLLGLRLGRLLNNQCTVGSGSGGPTGIVNAAVTAGNVTQLGSGNTASIAYSNLVTLEHSVDPAYRFNPSTRWMFSDAMLKLIKLLVDGNNRPLWQAGIYSSFQEGAQVDLRASKPTILDHPYIINQDMATPAASAYTILFGDMSTFKLRRVAGGITVQRLVERYADYLQIGLQAFMRADSNLIDAGTHPVAVLQQSAS